MLKQLYGLPGYSASRVEIQKLGKKSLFKPQHLTMAWNHLRTQGWLG